MTKCARRQAAQKFALSSVRMVMILRIEGVGKGTKGSIGWRVWIKNWVLDQVHERRTYDEYGGRACDAMLEVDIGNSRDGAASFNLGREFCTRPS